MNVLFLTHNFPRTEGDAAGSFLLRLAKALKAEGVTVHAIAPAGAGLPSSDTIEGISIERFRYAPRKFEKLAYTGNMAQDVASSWSARLTLLSFLGADFVQAVRARRSFEPDIIHAHWWFPNGVVGTWLKGLTHRPLITTLHGTDVRLARSVGVAKPLFRHVVQHSTKVTAVSRWLAEEAERVVSMERPTVAPMPVATDLFSPGGQRTPGRLLFVGRINTQKGIDHLLRSMARMKTKATLDAVGDGPAKEAMVQLATDLGISDRVNWVGQLKQPQLVDYYRKASVMVVPSIDEGLGLAAVEALLCETPVVAFNSGGLTDVVRDGQTGVLVPPGDLEALARALDDILGSEENARNLGVAGRIYALATFAPESAARRYADIYRQALDASPS
jgi:glycosyltransferase involved in cell wall biosynthesis